MKIEPYKEEYKNQLLRIFEKSIPKFFAEHELALFEKYLNEEGGTFSVALYQNRVVGGGGQKYHEGNHNGYITWLLIDPDFHSRGFGKILVENALSALRADERVQKLVVRTSQYAYKFFERMGFELLETKDDYWAKGIHLYYMEQAV